MTTLQFAIIGLGVGAAYVLVAQGIVLIYRGSGLLNFAQGTTALLTAQIFYQTRENLPTAAAMVIALAAAAGTGLVMQLIMQLLRRASALVRLIATLGVFMFVLGLGRIIWGTSTEIVADGLLPTVFVSVGDISVGTDRLILFGFAVLLTALLWFVYSHTSFGRSTAAVAENEQTALTLGLSPNLVGAANWMAGSLLAGVAGIAIAPISGLSVSNIALLVIPGLAAALVGNFSSFWLTLVGGLFLGVLQSVITLHVDTAGWSVSAPFILIVLLVMLRGRALPLRGDMLERPMRAGTGWIKARYVVPMVLAAVALVAISSDEWLYALSGSIIIAMVGLSVLLVTGYAGQLSLAQLTLAGIGALVAGQAGDAGWPFVPALVAGVLVSTAVGLLVGLPALRVRGVNLAVATIGLSLAIERLVLANPTLKGGSTGLVSAPPSMLGIDLDFLSHPVRFTLFLLAIFVLCAYLVTNVRRGATGRRLLALRNDERAAASLGVGVLSAKLYAFGLASALAGLAGALAAYRFRRVNLAEYTTLDSIMLVVNGVVGGVGYVFGAINSGLSAQGGAVAHALGKLDPAWVNGVAAIGGAAVLLVVLTTPDGVFGAWAHLARRLRTEPAAPQFAPKADSAIAHRETLVASDITVRFGAVTAVDNVSFEVRPGEVLGLIGANGAGKTTLVDALCGLVPASGSISLGDIELSQNSARGRAAAGLGRTFQSVDLFDDMTVLDNLRTASEAGERWHYVRDPFRPKPAELPAEVGEAINQLGLSDELNAAPDTLPSGRRRLVGMARTLAARPTCVFLDEPAAGLSDDETAELGRLIRVLAEEWNLPIVLIEHDVALVASVSDRIIALSLGQVIAQGTPDEVLRDPAVITSYLGTPPVEQEQKPELELSERSTS
ncbi:branched-chain amino acid ABC transporter permease/ATP-binding protein [Aeromicrobium panaciterrae]|uniref:branched-chain amino acid ABC transporter permease/ATP-binding protein n=1 Tax=Aeromicrobium panaciterrae TaxID=363861 RepID=UPI0031DEA06E